MMKNTPDYIAEPALIEDVIDQVVREMGDVNSPWTPTELWARLVFLENARDFGDFSRVFSEFSENLEENYDDVC